MLMHRFGTLNTLVLGHYIVQQVIDLMPWPWSKNINEKVQPPVYWEMVTKHNATLFVNLGFCLFVLLLYVPSQQLRPWRDGQFT